MSGYYQLCPLVPVYFAIFRIVNLSTASMSLDTNTVISTLRPPNVKPKDSIAGFLNKIKPETIDRLKNALKSRYTESLTSCYKVKGNVRLQTMVQYKVSLDKLTLQYFLLELINDILTKSHTTKFAIKCNAKLSHVFLWIEVRKNDFAAMERINKALDVREPTTEKLGISLNKIITEDFYKIEIPSDYKIISSRE